MRYVSKIRHIQPQRSDADEELPIGSWVAEVNFQGRSYIHLDGNPRPMTWDQSTECYTGRFRTQGAAQKALELYESRFARVVVKHPSMDLETLIRMIEDKIPGTIAQN